MMIFGTRIWVALLLLLVAGGEGIARDAEASAREMACESVINAAQARTLGRYAGRGVELQATAVSAVPDGVCDQILQVEAVNVTGASELPSQRVLAIVTGRTHSGQVVEIPVWFAVKAIKQVLVAGEDLLPGTALNEVPVTVERREVQGLAGVPVEALDVLHGMRVSRRVAKGEVITTRFLEPVPVVQRGQSVTLTSRRASIQVATPVVALQDGNIGDVVNGRRADGDQEVRMRIVAADQAEVVRP